MGFKLQYLCAAVLFLCLMKAVNIRAQCTWPSFESRNVDLSGSFLSAHSFPDGSIVTFECIIGHKPVNSRASKSVTCMGNQWTSLELTCTKKSCGSPPNFHNGRYEGTGVLFGDKMTAVCNTGYMLAGQIKDRRCRDQGWDGRDPVCEVVKCEAPPSIENGQLAEEPKDSYDYSEVVSYRCNKGLSLIGSSTLLCSEDGTFKPDPPNCLDGCPAPDIKNAQRIGGKSPPYKLGHFIDYKCAEGYTMIGDYHIVCSAEGWKPEPPKCIGPCSLPVFGGYVTLTEEFRSKKNFPHGSKVTFECIRGHKPVASTVSKSVTLEKCQAPPVIENGQIEAVSYKCHDGFFLTGSSKLYCSEDGTFEQDPPKCLDGCPTPEIPHAIRIGGKSPPYKLANFIEYKCEPGYIMRGEGLIVCTAKGWSPEPPQCIDGCPTPDIPHAVRIGGKSPPYKLGNFIDYKCAEGYTMIGDYHIVCSAEGWKPDPPKCIGPCGKPVLKEHVILTSEFSSKSIFPLGSKVTVECMTGYEPVDSTVSKSITCEETNWTKLLLTCKVVKCKTPPAIENGQLDEEPQNSYDYSQFVSYKCNGEFILTGSRRLHCSEDGTFKPDPPKCLEP